MGAVRGWLDRLEKEGGEEDREVGQGGREGGRARTGSGR
jgi:hypothetical protein